MKILSKQASLLVELVVALSIGSFIILQLSSFLVVFVQRMHSSIKQERYLLKQQSVLDMLVRDLDSAIDSNAGENDRTLITLRCWNLKERMPLEIGTITWSRVKGQLHRTVGGSRAPQVFGNVLSGLNFDCEKKIMWFIDEKNKVVEIAW